MNVAARGLLAGPLQRRNRGQLVLNSRSGMRYNERSVAFALKGTHTLLLFRSGAFMPSQSQDGRRFAFVSLLLAAGSVVGLVGTGAEPAKPKESKPAKAARPPWTASRVVGSPDPP